MDLIVNPYLDFDRGAGRSRRRKAATGLDRWSGRWVSEVYRNDAVAGALSAIRIFQFGRRTLTRSTVSKMALATAGSFNTLK
jgi:hypothetical protein